VSAFAQASADKPGSPTPATNKNAPLGSKIMSHGKSRELAKKILKKKPGGLGRHQK
jgi:hypothetical protein